MRRLLVLALTILILMTGCAKTEDGLTRGAALRNRLNSGVCSFQADILADFGDKTYDFSILCSYDPNGNLSFKVTAPDTISDISGTVSRNEGHILFADTVLTFPLLAEGDITPVSGPWLLLRALHSGYITSWCMESDKLRLSIDDSFQSGKLRFELLIDTDDYPIFGDIYWNGQKILSVSLSNFQFL